MTEQERIRNELYIRSQKYFKDFQEALFNGGENCPSKVLVDELLEYLHSQGGVIKVKKGKAGYVAVEPLIKEKK